MRLIMLGTGAAIPDPDRNYSAILITVAGRHDLFDCGHGATHQMVRANVHPARVDTVFLSHLHYDHIADFPFFMIATWMTGRENAPVVVGPPDTRHFVDSLLVDGAFRKDIEARAQYPQRQANFDVMKPDVRECEPGVVFEDDLVKVTACYVEHIPLEISPCFGLRMDTVDGQSVVFSGDTAPCDRLIALARGADLPIHECTFPEVAIRFREQAGIGTWAHTSPTDLGSIAKAAGVKELVATHFCAHQAPNAVMREIWSSHMPIEHMGTDIIDQMVADIRANWDGPLRMAHDGMRIDL
jgi:ribonuclease Z